MVEINDVIYCNELDKILVTPSPIDLTIFVILLVTSSGNLSIWASANLIICSASFCKAGVWLIKLLIFEMMIGATNATIKPIIANKANMIVVILAHLGKPTFQVSFEKVDRYKIKTTN